MSEFTFNTHTKLVLPSDHYIENQFNLPQLLNTHVEKLISEDFPGLFSPLPDPYVNPDANEPNGNPLDPNEAIQSSILHDAAPIFTPMINYLTKTQPTLETSTELMLSQYITIQSLSEVDLTHFDDITNQCLYNFSSYKYANGINELLDDDLSLYWQSDGAAPHSINIQLPQQSLLSYLCLYIDRLVDESYTPNEFYIKTGLTPYGYTYMQHLQLAPPPTGWLVIPLQDFKSHLDRLNSLSIPSQIDQIVQMEQRLLNNNDGITPTEQMYNINPFQHDFVPIQPNHPNQLYASIIASQQNVRDFHQMHSTNPSAVLSSEDPTFSVRNAGFIDPAPPITEFNTQINTTLTPFPKKPSFHLSLEILSSFQLGRDCRIHGLKLFAYKPSHTNGARAGKQRGLKNVPLIPPTSLHLFANTLDDVDFYRIEAEKPLGDSKDLNQQGHNGTGIKSKHYTRNPNEGNVKYHKYRQQLLIQADNGVDVGNRLDLYDKQDLTFTMNTINQFNDHPSVFTGGSGQSQFGTMYSKMR